MSVELMSTYDEVGMDHCEAVDIWALGVCIWQVVSLESPYENEGIFSIFQLRQYLKDGHLHTRALVI